MQIQLKLPQPYDPDLTLAALGTRATGLLYRLRGRQAARLLPLPGGATALVQVNFSAGPDRVAVTIEGAPDAATENECLAAVRHLFGLDLPMAEITAHLAADPLLAPAAHRYRGLRIVQYPSLYEALLAAIVAQQVSTAAAMSIRRRLQQEFGRLVAYGGEQYPLLPEPARLAAAEPERLQAVGLSRSKVRYIQALAAAAAAGALESRTFAALDDQAAATLLQRLPGVGRWTAEIALMWALGRLDILPAADLGLQVAIQRRTGSPERPSESQLRRLGERWQPWRSYAAFYLWQGVRDGLY